MAEQDINIMDELERKTLEALAAVMTDYEVGACSQPQASYALTHLFNATSGIVGNEVFEFISQASAEVQLDAGRDKLRRFFIAPNLKEMVLIEFQFGFAEVVIKRGPWPSLPRKDVMWERSNIATFEHELNPFEAARARYDGYAASLARLGFQEIQ